MLILRNKFLLLSSFIIITYGYSASAATMQFEELPAQNQMRITYGDLEITFADAVRGFGVNGIQHLGFSSQFGRYPTSGTVTGFWKIQFTNDVGASGTFEEIWNFNPATRSYSFDSNDGLTLFYTDLDLPGEADAVDVTVYVKPLAESGVIGWKIDVTNRSATYAIWDIVFPRIDFTSIDGDGPHSTLVVPMSEGRTYIDPIDGGVSDSGIMTGHGGGDFGLMREFVDAVATNDRGKIISGLGDTMESHRMVFAAEEARTQHCVIKL